MGAHTQMVNSGLMGKMSALYRFYGVGANGPTVSPHNQESNFIDRKLPVASLLSLTIAALLGGCGGSDSADKTTDPVPPTPTTKLLDVRAVDGYLKDAQVWLDINGDYALTEGEPTAITDGTGKASLVVTKVDHPEQYRVRSD